MLGNASSLAGYMRDYRYSCTTVALVPPTISLRAHTPAPTTHSQTHHVSIHVLTRTIDIILCTHTRTRIHTETFLHALFKPLHITHVVHIMQAVYIMQGVHIMQAVHIMQGVHIMHVAYTAQQIHVTTGEIQ